MNYEVIATLGPSSSQPDTWQAMLAAGATAFRLNTSHLTLESLSGWLERLQPFLLASGSQPPLYLDLQGSKWRLGNFSTCELVEGEIVRLVAAVFSEQAGVLPVPHADFFKAAPLSSGEIVLNDAKSRMQIENTAADAITARVTLGGTISAHKGITFASSTYRTEALNEKDRAIFAMTRPLPFIRYAISYLRDAAEMTGYRGLFGPDAYLAAKLERGPAMAEAAQVAADASELWVCRGDLGAELGLKGMAESVWRLSQQVREIHKPVIMAGQVLEHMTEHATPTRSEVCYLYDTLQQGYRGFVLSDEAAVGRYPVESCRAAALFQATH